MCVCVYARMRACVWGGGNAVERNSAYIAAHSQCHNR
jgi:hypothetical protein